MCNILTGDEVRQLTGAANRAKQKEILKGAGIAFIVRADGWPALTWSAVDSVLAKPRTEEEATAPINFDSI